MFSKDTTVGCPDHNNRPLEFYDKDDGQPVCSHCVVIGERQTHAIVPIDDIVSACISLMLLSASNPLSPESD